MIGKVIKDNYKIIDEIGRGAVATVYLAKDMARNQVVALKIIHPERAAEGQFLQRFQREAKLLQMLTSPQAVKVLDYGEDEGLHFIALEYVQGETLTSILEEEEGLLEVNRALDIAKQVALCLVDAHAKSIVHRDLRPANIMVAADGTVKVMDFGIAWGAELSRLTATGVLGSPHYLSPEQAQGKEVDSRSDIYSLGVTLFEMLSGRKPYDAEGATDIVLAHLHEPIPSLHQLDESIPLEVDELVRKCLAKKPEDRHQSAAELLEAIDATLRVIASRKEGITMGMEANLTGQTLGAYRIIEQIGRGGMATVYKAYEPALDRYVAIKVLPQYFAHDPDFAARFEREAKAVAKLDHPNILPIYSFGQEAGLTYIAMRYVEAGTLKEMLDQPLDLKATADILGQIGRALDYAHQRGIVHRDVKPTNVLMAEGEWALLTDFGLARMVESSVQLTKSGVGVGTPAYMSPEQGQGIKVDARSDVYSLGVVLYEMVTGKVPYEAETPMAVVIKHITAPLPLPREVNPGLPEAIERVILKAMAKAPEDRYQTVGEMVEALEKAVAGVPAVERPPEVKPVPVEEVPSSVVAEPTTPAPAVAVPVEAPPVTKKGLPGWVWGVVGAVVLLVVAGGIFLATRGEKPSPTPEATAALVATPPAGPEPQAPVSPGGPLPDAREVKPCDWDGLGPGLCIYSLEGGAPTKILEDAGLEIMWPSSWSPDGQQIAFSAIKPGEDPGRDATIHIVNADGSGLTELPSMGNDIAPDWSPDGEWLVFHSSANLAIMRPDGSDPAVIWYSEGRECAFEAQWSPDSQWIAVFMQIEGCEWTFPMTREVWVISRDGATVTTVATMTHENDSCVWPDVAFSPDGAQVAYFDADCRPWIVNADGSGQAAPLDEFPYWWTSRTYPQWGGEKEVLPPKPIPPAQPGGGKFLESCEGVMPWQICIRDDESGEVIQVTHDLDFGEPGRTTWSPDGEQIVFNAGSGPDAAGHYDHDLYVIDADGSGLRRITEGETKDLDPSWSPDGEWIAFHRDCGLWLVRPDGSGARELLPESDDFCVGSTSWSPDSQRIAFVDWHAEDDIHETWVVGRDGRDPHVVYAFQRVVDWIVSAWSPDGSQLACIYGGEGWSEGLVFDPEGGEPELLEENELPWHWDSNFWPQWGGERGAPPPALKPISPGNPPPDAREIEPCQWDNRGPGLCIYPSGGDTPTKILVDAELDMSEGGPPSWSPDGRQIAFSALKPGERPDLDSTIYIANADGSGLTELPQVGNDVRPAWSPDGQWLAFHSSGDLAIMRSDGSDPTVIWRGQGCTEEPQWSPDSQRIGVSIHIEGCEWTFPMTREVWVISRDGATRNTVATVTHENGECVWPEVAFSPDGKQVAYNDANCKPWLVNADGSGQAVPLDGFPFWWKSTVHPQWGVEKEAPPPEPIPPVQPEGKIVEPCEGVKPPQICVRETQTGQVTQVTSNLEFGDIEHQLVWSPDGQQIVFGAGSDFRVTQRNDHKLYVINADGSDLRQITSGDTNDMFPAWSPDGQWIAFHRSCDLSIIRPDGSEAQMLLKGSEKFCAAMTTWSPDSQHIAFPNTFGPGEETAHYEVWVVNRDGTDPRAVYSFEQPLKWMDVAWNPDGRQIACSYDDGGGRKALLINADGSGEPKVIDEMPWSWLPNFWPRWGGGELAPPPPPVSAPEAAPVPADPWGQVVVPPGDAIHIGLVAAFSGVWDWLGPAEENVFQMAVEDQGPIKGFPVSIIVADGGCSNEMGAAAAQAMISDPLIVGVIGHTCSSSCRAGAPVYEGAHLVMISPSCTGVDLSQLGYQIFNRVMVRDDQGGDERNLQPVNTDVYQDFAHRYQSRYGQSLLDEEWGVIAAYAYDATVILLQAIEQVAVVDASGNLVIGRQALANAVRATPGYQGITGVISFDSQGDRLP